MARLNETRISAVLTERIGGAFTRTAATSRHTEHGTLVIVGLDADVAVAGDAAAVRGRAVIVPPDVAHAARCPGPVVTFNFDPELGPALAAVARRLGGPCALDGGAAARVVGAVIAERTRLACAERLVAVGDEIGRALTGGAVDGLGGPGAGGDRIDRRVAHLVEALRDPADDAGPAVARTRLSAAHLQALFARDIGIPIRSYRLWRRLLHGVARVGPLDLTASAHAAGFADLAHFSRTCRRLLGYAPSVLRASLVTG